MSLVRYPLDLTGENPSNLVVDDVQHLPINGGRVISPAYSPFFVDSLIIEDENGRIMEKGIDWEPALHYVAAMQASGKEVAAVIEFYSEDYFGDITIRQCQVLGGHYGTDAATVYTLIRGVDVNQAPTLYWDDFLPYYNTEVPIDEPNPSESIGYTIRQINRLRDTITLNSSKAVTYTSNEIIAAITLANERLENLNAKILAHTQDNTTSSHQMTTLVDEEHVAKEALPQLVDNMLQTFVRENGSVLDASRIADYSLDAFRQIVFANLSAEDFEKGKIPTASLITTPTANAYLASNGEVIPHYTGYPVYFNNIEYQWPDERILEDHEGMPVGFIIGFVPVEEGKLDGYHRYIKTGVGHLWEKIND